MRRGSTLLMGAGPVIVSVGASAAATASSQGNVMLAWCTKNPANATGFVNTATVVVGSSWGSGFAILTVSPAGIVADITSTIGTSLSVGANNVTLPAPLAVNAGDYVGIWANTGTSFGINLSYASETGLNRVYRANSAIAKPAPGSDVSGSVPSSIANTYFKISAAT